MIKTANSLYSNLVSEGKGGKAKEVRFEQGFGEDLSKITTSTGRNEKEVDLVIAGQAAHWFNAEKVYSELRRVLKPGGSFVFFGYGEFFFPKYKELTKLIPLYSGGTLG